MTNGNGDKDKGGTEPSEADRGNVQKDHDTMPSKDYNDKYGITPGEPYTPVPGNPDDATKH
jgi:hypothetical protein